MLAEHARDQASSYVKQLRDNKGRPNIPLSCGGLVQGARKPGGLPDFSSSSIERARRFPRNLAFLGVQDRRQEQEIRRDSARVSASRARPQLIADPQLASPPPSCRSRICADFTLQV